MKSFRKYLVLSCFQAILLLTGCADKEQKVYRVGVLFSLEPLYPSIDGFKEKLTKLGYMEGKKIIYDIHKVDINMTLIRQILDKFVADKVDLILVAPTESALVAKEVTKGTDIPVVFTNTVIEGNDLVESVNKPGGHVTGVRIPGPEYNAKRLEILHEIKPDAKRIWMAFDPSNSNIPPTIRALQFSAQRMNMTLVEIHIKSLEDIKSDLERRDKLDDIGIDAINGMPDWISSSPESWKLIDEFALKHKIPIVSAALDNSPLVLIGYFSDSFEVGENAAIIADKIFKGTPPGTIPVFSPEAHLQINYKVAQEMGIKVPENVLAMADKIIR